MLVFPFRCSAAAVESEDVGLDFCTAEHEVFVRVGKLGKLGLFCLEECSFEKGFLLFLVRHIEHYLGDLSFSLHVREYHR